MALSPPVEFLFGHISSQPSVQLKDQGKDEDQHNIEYKVFTAYVVETLRPLPYFLFLLALVGVKENCKPLNSNFWFRI